MTMLVSGVRLLIEVNVLDSMTTTVLRAAACAGTATKPINATEAADTAATSERVLRRAFIFSPF